MLLTFAAVHSVKRCILHALNSAIRFFPYLLTKKNFNILSSYTFDKQEAMNRHLNRQRKFGIFLKKQTYCRNSCYKLKARPDFGD